MFLDSALLVSPFAGHEENLCARLFTHRELADAYAEQNSMEVRALSSIEVIQATKTALLAGGTAWAVNEGDKSQVCVSLSGLLRLFLLNVLKDENLYDDKAAKLLTFLHQVSYNVVYRLSAECEPETDDTWLEQDGAVTVFAPQTTEREGVNLRPVSISMLFRIPSAAVRFVSGAMTDEFSTDILQHALVQCGFSPASPAHFPADFQDEAPQTRRILTDWRTRDISLTCDTFLVSERTQAPSVEESVSEEERRETRGVESKTTEADDSARSDTQAMVALPDSADRSRKMKRERKKGRGKHRVLFAILAVVLTLILVVAIILFVQHTRYRKNFIQFCEYIDDREYGRAYEVYQNNHFYKDGTSYLTKTIDSLVLAYAQNTLSAEELNASLTALEQFPGTDDSISIARLTAAKLEESKNAYVMGQNSYDVYTRLSYWRKVIELDSVNYTAARNFVMEHQADYEPVLADALEYYSTRHRGFARSRWQLLSYWYPNSEVTEKWRGEYEEDRTEPLGEYPVQVTHLSVQQEEDQYWALRIDWMNISVKTIKDIRFSLIALDEQGNVLTCSDSYGAWTIFDAKDPGPFEPGGGHDATNYVWHHAWYNADIAEVTLTGVYIEYKDGSIQSFTQDVDLSQIHQ